MQEQNSAKTAVGQKSKVDQRQKCPYLDTINRNFLDFDFEKVCSVSLTNLNVYACLVCGKFFQGRGRNTHAYTHSVQAFHHVWIHLGTNKIYCLPDNYEVVNTSLNDIKRALKPEFTRQQLGLLDQNTTLARDVYGVSYLPGFVGLNNLKSTDFVNVVLQALAHVTPLRDFFLQPQNYHLSRSQLVHRFGEVMRKMWSKDNFKSCVSPHEFVQEVTVASKKRFRIGQQAECIDFLAWLLHSLHVGLGGHPRLEQAGVMDVEEEEEDEQDASGGGLKKRKKKPKKKKKKKLRPEDLLGITPPAEGPTVIQQCFQGVVHVKTLTRKKRKLLQDDEEDSDEEDKDGGAEEKKGGDEEENGNGPGWDLSQADSPFLQLTLAIPQTPLFKDSQGGNIIPQVPLFTALQKFDGDTWTDIIRSGSHQRKQYRLKRLPTFLILHLARFTKNNFFVEKNPTIVNFPVKNLELREYLEADKDSEVSEEEVKSMSMKDLKALLRRHNIDYKGCVERSELEDLAKDFILTTLPELLGTKYDLLANICHDSPPGQGKEGQMDPLRGGSYRAHCYNKASDQWYELQDLHVVETMPQLIGLSESYIMIYERKKGSAGQARELAAELYGIGS